MKDNFNYGEDSEDGQLLLQSSEEERIAFFHSDQGVVEEMKRLDEYLDFISDHTQRSRQEIVDFLFGQAKQQETASSQTAHAVQGSVSDIIGKDKFYLHDIGEYGAFFGKEEDIRTAAPPEAETRQYLHDIAPEDMLGIEELITDSALSDLPGFSEDPKTENPDYDMIGKSIEGRRMVCRKGLYGFMDEDGREVVGCRYESVNNYHEGLALVSDENGLYGYIDLDGRLLIECRFNDALDFSGGLAAVKLNSRWGYIDRTGKTAIRFEFHDAESFVDGKAKVIISKQTYQINKMGLRMDA